MALNQLVGYGEGRNDVAAGAASGNKNSQFRQLLAFLQRSRLIKLNFLDPKALLFEDFLD